MIPLNDTEPNRYTSFPFMTMALICANMLVLIAEELIAETDLIHLVEIITLYGATPTLILRQEGGGGLTSITHMFLHGGFIHLAGNMLALWVYGRRVEDVCGPWRFLFFYLICGVFADIIHTIALARSDVPGIGASGAVYGIMGAYLILFPAGRIRTLVILGVVPIFLRIRAYWLILYFLILEIPPALNILVYQADYQVAHWAHLGGFFGSVFVFLFLSPPAFHRYRNELPL
jgi:membrane associated rhomboid family serine protease